MRYKDHIYILRDPDSQVVRYVGLTRYPEKRLAEYALAITKSLTPTPHDHQAHTPAGPCL